MTGCLIPSKLLFSFGLDINLSISSSYETIGRLTKKKKRIAQIFGGNCGYNGLQFFSAATNAMTHASSKLPSRFKQSRSQWRTQTHLEFWMHSVSRSIMILLFTNSAMNWVAAWAVSPGGPDLICEEHKAGSVTFGMMNPLDDSSLSGGAIS